MQESEYEVGELVEMKKPHPCGTNRWEIVRTGVDFKLRCTGCGHVVMIPRQAFIKAVKMRMQ